MTIYFTEDFDYRVNPSLTIAYVAGMELEVDDETAAAAIRAGAAISNDDPDTNEDE